ncbi:AAA family ATPase [Nocardia fluminea]|uniref:AAA family ATPase n=1 Tax=Nocardia fluminea TaxID=134984 RepID=UPI00364F3B54
MATVVSAKVKGLAGNPGTKTIKFESDTTVLFGLNGSGKTSLLKILNSALTGDSSILYRVPFESAEILIREGDQEFKCSITQEALRASGEVIEEMLQMSGRERMSAVERERYRLMARRREAARGWSVSPEIPGHYVFNHRYLPTSRLTNVTERSRTMGSSAAAEFTEDGIDRVFAEKIETLWRDYSQRELIEERAIQQEGLAAILSSVLNRPTASDVDSESLTDNADEAYTTLMKFFRDQKIKVRAPQAKFTRLYKEDPLLRNVVAKITEVERKVAEAHSPSRRIENLVSSLYTGNKQVSMERSIIVMGRDSKKIPIALLSSGEKQVLLILLETLTAKEDVVIIDEPELSMHVDWQNELVSSMRAVNSEAQLILATHSPEVIAGVSSRCVKEL